MHSLDDHDVLDRRLAELRGRHAEFPNARQPFVSLAEAIAWCAKVPAEMVVIEATSGPRRPMADVKQEEARHGEAELERARNAALDLENGLRLAWQAGLGGEIVFDSRDPAADRIAGALISLLVASDFATVRTEELGDEQYRYGVTVNWEALDAFAARIGLPPVLEMLTSQTA